MKVFALSSIINYSLIIRSYLKEQIYLSLKLYLLIVWKRLFYPGVVGMNVRFTCCCRGTKLTIYFFYSRI